MSFLPVHPSLRRDLRRMVIPFRSAMSRVRYRPLHPRSQSRWNEIHQCTNNETGPLRGGWSNQRQAPLEHRLPGAGTGQERHDHRSGRIGEERPGPDFGVNVSSPVYVHKHLISLQTSAFPKPIGKPQLTDSDFRGVFVHGRKCFIDETLESISKCDFTEISRSADMAKAPAIVLTTGFSPLDNHLEALAEDIKGIHRHLGSRPRSNAPSQSLPRTEQAPHAVPSPVDLANATCSVQTNPNAVCVPS